MLSLLSFSQQQITTASISHYVNSELYLKGGIVTYLGDKAGNPLPGGKFVTIYNSSGKPVFYSPIGGGRSLKELKPGQKVVVPVKNEAQAKAVKLLMKYSPDESNFSKRVPSLSKMNAETERNLKSPTQNKAVPNNSIRAAIETKPVAAPVFKTTITKAGLAKHSRTGKLNASSGKTPVRVLPPSKAAATSGPFNCLYAPQPAYYTFYFLKTGNEILFSDPFGVSFYSDEDTANQLLDEVLSCIEERLKKKFDEKKFERLLIDPDNGLELGVMHLQHTSMGASEIRARYPYTTSKDLASKELTRWIQLERKNHKGLIFVRI